MSDERPALNYAILRGAEKFVQKIENPTAADLVWAFFYNGRDLMEEPNAFVGTAAMDGLTPEILMQVYVVYGDDAVRDKLQNITIDMRIARMLVEGKLHEKVARELRPQLLEQIKAGDKAVAIALAAEYGWLPDETRIAAKAGGWDGQLAERMATSGGKSDVTDLLDL